MGFCRYLPVGPQKPWNPKSLLNESHFPVLFIGPSIPRHPPNLKNTLKTGEVDRVC